MILGRPRFAFSWLVAGRASNFQGRRQLNKTIKNQLGNIWLWGGRQALSDGQLQQNQIKSPLRCLNDMEWNYVTIKKRDDESMAQNLAKMTSDLAWIALDWIGVDWTGLNWIGLDWTGLDWVGLVWTGVWEKEERPLSRGFTPLLSIPNSSCLILERTLVNVARMMIRSL